jgi:hypothetical protein
MALAPTIPCLGSCGHELDLSPDCFALMRESTDLVDDPAALRSRLADDGYVLLRDHLIRDEVVAARRFILERLSEEGHLDASFPVMEGVTKPGADLWFEPRLAQLNNAALQRLLYRDDGPMIRLFERILGGPVVHFDYTWLRVLSKGHGTRPHCDIVYMGRGTKELYTAWTPLGDAPLELGGLMVLESSHKIDRLRATYGRSDVDSYCANRPERPKRGFTGPLGADPNQVRKSLGGRWLTHSYGAGDIVIFSTFLVHGGLDNQTDRLRISSDSRYQRHGESQDERWMGHDPAAHGPRARRGRIC